MSSENSLNWTKLHDLSPPQWSHTHANWVPFVEQNAPHRLVNSLGPLCKVAHWCFKRSALRGGFSSEDNGNRTAAVICDDSDALVEGFN